METAVLLHGFTHTGASWDRVIGELGASWRALAPDLPGHGRASAPAPVSLQRVIDGVAAAAPETFVLGGYSMGGRLALHVALALPERVSGLVLVGASPGIADAPEREARRAVDEALADRFDRATGIEEVVEIWERRIAELDSGDAHEDRLRNTPAGLAAALRGLGTGALPPLWDRLAELTMPVTLVVGEHDPKFRSIAQQMTPLIADAHINVVQGARHAAHLEAPAAVAAVLAERYR